MNVTISVPHSGPALNDDYVVLLSIWDDAAANWYDQIGIASFGGAHGADDWTITYEQVGNCGSYVQFGGTYDPGWLFPGSKFNFQLALYNGNLVFSANALNYGNQWTTSTSDSATNFRVSQLGPTSCELEHARDGYTNYEEVWATSFQQVPDWNFNFTNNYAGGNPAGPWANASDPGPSVPSVGYWVVTSASGSWSELANQALGLSMSNGYWSAPAGSGQSLGGGGYAFNIGPYCRNNHCYVNVTLGLPVGWGSSNSMAYPLSAQITSSSCPIQVLINPPMSAPSGFYYPALYVGISTTPNGPIFEFTSYIYYIVLT